MLACCCFISQATSSQQSAAVASWGGHNCQWPVSKLLTVPLQMGQMQVEESCVAVVRGSIWIQTNKWQCRMCDIYTYISTWGSLFYSLVSYLLWTEATTVRYYLDHLFDISFSVLTLVCYTDLEANRYQFCDEFDGFQSCYSTYDRCE